MTRWSPLSNSTFFPALLAALSHELGSPLAAIKGAATTLLDYRQRLPDERVEGFLRSIDAQTDRLSVLHEDFVRLAQIAAGLLHLDAEALDLRLAISNSLADLLPDQRDDFSIEGTEVRVLADPAMLRRAFNLLFQHLHDHATGPTIIRLAVTRTHVTAHIFVDDPDLADPLIRLDQVIRSDDPTRSKQAVVWLRLALSRGLIEVQGGQWTWVGAGAHDRSSLIIALPGTQSEPNSGGQ